MVRRERLEYERGPEESADSRAEMIGPRERWKGMILMREDIGYGPARQYEGAGPGGGGLGRERRGGRRRERFDFRPPGEGPYWRRLARKRRPDQWTRAEIEESLFLDTWIDADGISVEVEDGIVTLIGTLTSRGEAERAIDTARRVPGVRVVRDRIDIEP